MEKIRVTKSQKFDVSLRILERMRELEPDFQVKFEGTDSRDGVVMTLDSMEEFYNSEKAQLAKKNANTNNPEKMSDVQKQNEQFKVEIKEFLATLPVGEDAPAGYTATEIFLGTSISKSGFQLPKVTALLSALSDGTKVKPGTHEVVRVKGSKGVTLFRLA